MSSRSVIARSNQSWKLILGSILLVGCALTDAIVSFMVLPRTSAVNNNWLHDLFFLQEIVDRFAEVRRLRNPGETMTHTADPNVSNIEP